MIEIENPMKIRKEEVDGYFVFLVVLRLIVVKPIVMIAIRVR